jgi:hypothetical protein
MPNWKKNSDEKSDDVVGRGHSPLAVAKVRLGCPHSINLLV